MNTLSFRNAFALISESGLQQQFSGCVCSQMIASYEVVFSQMMHPVTKRWVSLTGGWTEGG